jgi:hypothetical protein
MSKSVELFGSKEFAKAAEQLVQKNKSEANKILAAMANDTRNSAVEGIQGGGRSGKVYKRRSITHQASAPGEFPKTDTGELANNITVRKNGFADYDAGSRQQAPHGFWLEFGTRFMAKRPWLTPSFNETLRKFRKFFD